jgi:hypothetical protein
MAFLFPLTPFLFASWSTSCLTCLRWQRGRARGATAVATRRRRGVFVRACARPVGLGQLRLLPSWAWPNGDGEVRTQ